MLLKDALKIRREFLTMINPKEEDEYLFEEAMQCLIKDTKNSGYMLELGQYFEERDYARYIEIIEELYQKVKHTQCLCEPLPECFVHLARIRTEEGEIDEAIDLYCLAKDFLAQRISSMAGSKLISEQLYIMRRLIQELYKLVEREQQDMDFFDLYYFLTKPVHITFDYNGEIHDVQVVEKEWNYTICFDDKSFQNVDDFFLNAEIQEMPLTAIYDQLFHFETV